MRPSPPLAKSTSSKRWLGRQFRDPYVRQRMASPALYRSRSAFKLLEMDEHYKFISRLPARTSTPEYARLRPRVIVDLGAAPGGWSQVVALKSGYTDHLRPREDEPADMELYGLSQSAKLQRRGAWSDHPPSSAGVESSRAHEPAATADAPLPTIIAVDLLRMLPIPGVHVLQTDFLSPSATDLIRMHLPHSPDAPQGACVDLLLSDMAANATGNPAADVAHSLQICDAVARFAEQHLKVGSATAPGGTLVLKYFMHPDTQQFCRTFLQPSFRRVYPAKPPSSRAESAEGYWICVDWLGGPSQFPPPPIPTDSFQFDLPILRKGVPWTRRRFPPPGPRPKPVD